MTVEYVSWKAGDPLIKPSPQAIKPKTWTTLIFEEGSAIVPKHNGTANWAHYINVNDAGGAKNVKVRYLRDPKGIKDFTGQVTHDLTIDHIFSDTWFFNAKVGQPIALQVYHEGKKNMVITTREFKMWIP